MNAEQTDPFEYEFLDHCEYREPSNKCCPMED